MALTMDVQTTKSEDQKLTTPDDGRDDKKITESHIYSYFTQCNSLCKGIISEQRSLTKFLGDRWCELDSERKDSLLDLLFVEDDMRQTVINSRQVDEEGIRESYPRLLINSGQKINVDFENDLWAWRDEHSGPFSWMSRSQQDLTLIDTEPENITKPQPKTLRIDLDNEENMKEAEKQFSYPANCWSRDIIDEYRKVEKNITLSPCTSIEFSNSQLINQDEETNETSEEIREDIQTQEDEGTGKVELEDRSEEVTDKRRNSGKEKRKRSPSPKKILRSSSLRRSPSKASDGGEQQLISKNSDENYEEQNAFSNPLVETQWSSFVGEDAGESSTDVDNVPLTQVIDRGEDVVSRSPYQIQKDSVLLITPEESPSQSNKAYSASNDLGTWSVESTPDHTTHLLKGMEDKKNKLGPSSYQFSSQEPSGMKENKDDDDEILTVETVGTDFTISTTSENKRESNIPTTGFDFLDNW